MKSLSGETIISCFFDRIRRNVKSFCGSKSLTTLLALAASWDIRAEYCSVDLESSVDLIGTPNKVAYTHKDLPSVFTITIPDTPL